MSTALISREPIKVLADIIQSEMSVPDGRIMLEYQKFDIDPDPGLYIALAYVNPKAMSSNNYFDCDALTEIQKVVMSDLIQIDIMSFSSEARDRRVEVLMALNSNFSKRMQEQNTMKIARLPMAFANASNLEETGFLNRFVIRFMVYSIYSKTKSTDYYKDFPSTFVTSEKKDSDPAIAVDVESPGGV